MACLKTKKRNLSESDSDTEFNELPKFIVLESMDETPLNKLSPFLIEKVKKIRNGHLLVKVTK